MASNSSGGDPTSTTEETLAVSTTTKPPLVTAPAAPSSTRPVVSPPQLHPLPQPKTPQFLHQHPQRHHPYQNQQHQPGLFGAPPAIQPPQIHLHPHLGKAPDSIRYPLASSGRGLLPAPRGIHPHLPEQVTGCSAYPPMPSSMVPNSSIPPQFHHQHSRFSAPVDSSNCNHSVRGHILQLAHGQISSVPISSGAAKVSPLNNFPQPKDGSSPYSAPDRNAPKDPIDKDVDDQLATLRDRKVRISEGSSLYALCRSWLRNGYVEENQLQLQYGDVLKSLPKPLPLPLPLPESFSPKRKETDDETETDKVENLGEVPDAEELLRRHVKRAKRVRARLREERLQRIERYKSRLALLLPPNGAMHE